MAKRIGNPFLSRSFQRTLGTMARKAVRAGAQAVTQTLRAKPAVRKAAPAKRLSAAGPAQTHWSSGIAVGAAGARRYHLYKPVGVRRAERLPLLVMLHGCGQDAEAMAASTQMNRLAARERFIVLYPEQDRVANVHRCWNWYETRSGRAQAEAHSIDAAITQVCLTQPVDPLRIGVAGLSAGAGMAALLATRHPERFRAIAMHSGIAPGVAHSSATALSAMRGRAGEAKPQPPLADGQHLPALLVIQGSVDHIVARSNGTEAARSWAAHEGALAGATRRVQRGARYAAAVTDYKTRGRLVATLCEVSGLGHAWSGGAAGQAYSDPKGPNASSMIWAFMTKQFAR